MIVRCAEAIKGSVAHNYIIGGGIQTLIGSYEFKISPSQIRGILEPLSVSYHCGGMVDWDALEEDLSGLMTEIATLRNLGIV